MKCEIVLLFYVITYLQEIYKLFLYQIEIKVHIQNSYGNSFSEVGKIKELLGKSFLELWVTTFLSDWQLPLIFVRFISNFFCMCSYSMASAHVTLK